jgi:hypothetical protein
MDFDKPERIHPHRRLDGTRGSTLKYSLRDFKRFVKGVDGTITVWKYGGTNNPQPEEGDADDVKAIRSALTAGISYSIGKKKRWELMEELQELTGNQGPVFFLEGYVKVVEVPISSKVRDPQLDLRSYSKIYREKYLKKSAHNVLPLLLVDVGLTFYDIGRCRKRNKDVHSPSSLAQAGIQGSYRSHDVREAQARQEGHYSQ